MFFFESKSIKHKLWKEYYIKNNHLGAYMSLSTCYQLTNKIELKFNVELNAFLGFYVEKGTQYYHLDYYKINDEIIKNNIDTENYTIPSTRPEYYNFNTLNFSLGIRYYFGIIK